MSVASIVRGVPAAAGRRGMDWIGWACFVFAAVAFTLVVFQVRVGAISYRRDQQVLGARLKESLAAPGSVKLRPGVPVARIRAPGIGLDAVVVEGTSNAQLASAPGHLRMSPMPGASGNVVIAGRRTTYGAPFRNLDQLRRGDDIAVAGSLGAKVYRVASVKVLHKGDPDRLGPSTDSRLTLVTSDPVYRTSGRLVVTAELRGVGVRAPARTRALAPDEIGLTRSPGSGLRLFVRSQFLLLVVAGAILAYRRLPRTAAYLVTTPVSAAALIWWLEGIVAMLPSTL